MTATTARPSAAPVADGRAQTAGTSTSRRGVDVPAGALAKLQALADAWDAAAAEIEAAAALVAEHAPLAVHPGHKLIARGRARQLTACAEELRRALDEQP